jgi:DNA-binding MarR family transcriptional regulator
MEAEDLIGEIVHHIRRLMQAGEFHTKELDKKWGLTAPQLHCILALHEKGPQPPSLIAKRILVKSSTVTGIVDRLERKGLVTRARTSRDRRTVNVALTPEGRGLAEKAPASITQSILDGLRKLSTNEIEQIARSLSKLTQMLDV